MKTMAKTSSVTAERCRSRKLMGADCSECVMFRPQKPCDNGWCFSARSGGSRSCATDIRTLSHRTATRERGPPRTLQPEIVPENRLNVFLDDDFVDRLAGRNHREHVLGVRDDNVEDVRFF